ncbi:shikimate kinase [Arcticibacter sp. MXS-1]|uniref:shikimate kinase n=1 Tax=Arcticibacter sp. MXS-1 TaxID=3341726 RepID=UPI0035A8E0BF
MIFLIGFMGSGKTTLGKKLALRLSVPFIDLDHLLQERAGMTVPDYFSQHGEQRFRELEKDVLQSSVFPASCVVATGGGAPCYFNNMEWMNNNGLTVYLSLPPAVLAARLEKASEVRPVLKDHKGEALVSFIGSKLSEREPFYSQAKLTVSGISLTAEKLAAAIRNYQRR